MNFTQEQVNNIVWEAKHEAAHAATKFFNHRLNGVDQGCCGFAWTIIPGVKGNSRLGRMLKAAGVRQDYTRAFHIWNPSGMGVQNVDTLEVGAEAAARVFIKHGIDAYAGSRLD